MVLGSNSEIIFRNRYAIHENETWEELAERVGQGGAHVEQDFIHWRDVFASDIYNMLFLPGGRILRNVGRPRGTLFNCYVEPLDDSMKQIGDFQRNCGILWSEGGGVGCNASFLRPEDAPIIQKGGESSGPISFLKWANAGANCIKTGGARRAAALAMMNVDHPDIIKFINAKLVEGELNCFNISVAVTEEFLQAVEADDNWDLRWKTKVWQTVRARDIWDLILKNMVSCAEPGLINWDNLRSNNSYYFDPILCFTGDTLISTTNGLIKISDLVDKKINTISDLRVIGSQGTFIEEGIGFKSGTKEVFEVVLKNNQKIKLTSNHKVWTKNGWKEVKDLEINKDYMYVQNSISQHFVNNIDDKEDFDNGYMVGLLVGDGWLCNTDKSVQYGFCFHESEENMMNFVEEKINYISDGRKINWRRSSNNSRSFELTSSSKSVNDYFKKWGYTYKINDYGYINGTKRSTKFISDEVLKETPSFKRGFISGLYDSDGSIQRVGKGNTGKGKKIILVTSKKHIAERLQIMLNEFGIPSSVGSRISNLNEKLYVAYTVNISRILSCNAFKKLIGFNNSEKKNRINEYKFGSSWNEKYYGMFKVKSIKSLGEQEVYDIETNTTHSLIANGIVVHNSTNPCGEVPLGAHGVCCLGSLVLPNFITGTKNTNWQLMERTVHNAIRFLDNIIQVNRYVIEDVKRKAFDGRRIGLGVMGLAEYLFAKGVRYGSKESTRVINILMENIRNYAYEASCKLAEEKEAFPKFDVKEYSKAHFFKTLPASLRMSIKKHGMRNVSVMAVAPTGCQDKNTMIVTNQGILSLEEIGNINGDKWQDINMYVSQEKYRIEEKASKFYINGKSNTKKIYLKSGNVLESTYNHQYRVLEDDNYIWKRADEIKIGDDIISVLNTYNKHTNPDLKFVDTTHGNQNDIKKIPLMNEKLSEFLGIYFGDGSNHNKGIRINCNVNNEEEYLYVAELGKEIFGISPTFSDNNRNCMAVCFNSQLILNFFKLNGLLKQKSNEISIPKILRSSSINCLNAFIKGLIFADGSKSGNNIFLDTASKKLSKELLVIIRALGNDVRIQEHISGLGSKIYRVWIKKGVYKYRPLHEQKKKERLESLGLYYCIVDEVVCIKNSENYTYDIEVPNTVTYIANSVVSHNTISLLPEVTSSAEPLFCKAYLRDDQISKRAYIHPIYERIIENNDDIPDWYVDSFDLKPEDHFETQVAIQRYTDGAVSKTVNCPKGFKAEQLSDLLLEYIRDLKGVTVYVDGSREGQILNPLTMEQTKKYLKEGKVIREQEERDCSIGACEI